MLRGRPRTTSPGMGGIPRGEKTRCESRLRRVDIFYHAPLLHWGGTHKSNNMSTVYLHIGRGKTGTTAIQRAIGLNRDHFLSQGINYLLADDRASGIGHQDFAKCFVHNYPDYMIRPQSPNQTLADVEREIKKSRCPQILISSENFTLANVAEVRKFLASSLFGVGSDSQSRG